MWGPMEYDNGVNILCKTNLLVQYNLIELHRRNATNPSLVPNDPLFRNAASVVIGEALETLFYTL